MPNITNPIWLEAGACYSKKNHILKGGGSDRVRFPAGFWLFEDSHGKVNLYDTGYGAKINAKTIKSWAYRQVLPVEFNPNTEGIWPQLQAMGVTKIDRIIISHLHPDHIGGLKTLPNDIPIYITPGLYETYNNPGLTDLVWKEYIPDNFEERLEIIDLVEDEDNTGVWRGPFIDENIQFVALDGHCRQLLCLDFKDSKTFLAADASWGQEFLQNYKNIKRLPMLIMHDKEMFIKTNEYLLDLQENQEYKVIFSHDEKPEEAR